jgi:branched-chain amino acid transport system permease protein
MGLLVISPFGLGLRGIRGEGACRPSATTCGYKYIAFVLSGSSAASQARSGAYYSFVSPNDVQLVTSVETLLMVALGGSGTLIGPALGAGIIVFLKNFVSVYTKRWLLILGGVDIGVILFAPRGVMGALRGRPR